MCLFYIYINSVDSVRVADPKCLSFIFDKFYLNTLDGGGGGGRDFLVVHKPSEFLFILIVYGYINEHSGTSRF